MTWILNASGHADDTASEATTIDGLRTAVREAGAHVASVTTSYHGQVNLLEDGDSQEASTD